jgi:hypothetical protein
MVISIATRPNISLLVQVATEMDPVHYLGQTEYSDVKFTHRRIVPVVSSDEQRIGNVLLNHPFLANSQRLQKLLNFVKVRNHTDSLAPVGILSRFANPNLFLVLSF